MKNLHGLLNSCYSYSHMDFSQYTFFVFFLSFQVLHRFSFPRKVTEHVLLCILTPRDTQHKTDVIITRLSRNGKTWEFFIVLPVQLSKYAAGSWDNYERNFDWIWCQMRKIFMHRRYQFSFYKVKIINKPDFIISFFPVVLTQKSWLEKHMNKSVWIYWSLFISAVYTSKLWTTSFSETVKKLLQKHQLNWFKKISRPCPKWLND